MTDFIQSKFCRKCSQVKQLSEFYKERSGKDGHRNQCKVCIRLEARQKRKSPEGNSYQKRYNKQYQRTEKYKQWHLEYKRNHREKIIAQIAVSIAVRAGKLPRVSTLKCSNCPKQASHYHHHKGYASENHLKVIPVCTSCHKNLHSLS